MVILPSHLVEKKRPFLSVREELEDPGVGEDHKGALLFLGGRVVGPLLEPLRQGGRVSGGLHDRDTLEFAYTLIANS